MKRLFNKTISLALMGIIVAVATFADTTFASNKSDQRKVQREIEKLSRQIGTKKKESDDLNSQVTKLEKELGVLSSKQHNTEQEIEDARARLLDANAQKVELDEDLKQQQGALAQQLQAMHTAGEQSHLRLLLLQDNPSDISRNIQYFDYLNRYRSKKINEISEITDELNAVTRTAKKERDELRDLQKELELQKAQVQLKLSSREAALQTVSLDLNSKKKRRDNLEKEEKNLQREIERLARRAAKKRAEAAARKEAQTRAANKKREQARIAANKRNQQRRTTAANARQKTASTQKAVARKPAKPARAAGRKVTTTRTPNKAFSKLRGQLSWPVNGRVIYKYNSRRNEKQRWKGIVIAARGGSKVKTVAAGKVVFAGWMNGYGHLIIIEHDRNYMSLYGYNRAVFKRVGQRVKANETIAAVGNSSGQSKNALYFEIRRKTVPQNPARWLR